MARKKKAHPAKAETIEFVSDSSPTVASANSPVSVTRETPTETDESSPGKTDFESRSPAFRALATPQLPQLERENRARLQVQSPNKAFFYWSFRSNPFQALHRSLGADAAGYTLVLRLIDLEIDREEMQYIEPEGTHWFNTEAGRSYRAEIGFYSTSRPFVRILYSNTITTPRKSPSPRAASEAEWRVTSHKFAEVLDVSGFPKDAFDVAIAGDEPAAAEATTLAAFEQLMGTTPSLDGVPADEIRFALMSIAAGRTIEELRWKIGAALFGILQRNAENLNAERAAASVKQHFNIDEIEFDEDEIAATVFGASAVNFPRRFKTPGYSPLSSSSPLRR